MTPRPLKSKMPDARSLPLRGAVALITGAASGIGAALADTLARRGSGLALVDIDACGLEATAERARAHGVEASTHALDLADNAATATLPAAVRAAHGRLTVLVNNAGIALGGRFEDIEAEDFDALMALNFGATVRLTRAFLPLLAAEPAAQLVNISSIFGIIAPPGQTAYCASKFAVRGFSESLRHELEAAGSPVGVTLVHPGGVRTRIAIDARVGPRVDPTERDQQQKDWTRLLVLPPERAAERIARAIERREPRVLVGDDARRAAWVQRLFPVGYWKLAARELARRIGREPTKAAR
jgi:short-subunit dehydrogenase